MPERPELLDGLGKGFKGEVRERVMGNRIS